MTTEKKLARTDIAPALADLDTTGILVIYDDDNGRLRICNPDGNPIPPAKLRLLILDWLELTEALRNGGDSA